MPARSRAMNKSVLPTSIPFLDACEGTQDPSQPHIGGWVPLQASKKKSSFFLDALGSPTGDPNAHPGIQGGPRRIPLGSKGTQPAPYMGLDASPGIQKEIQFFPWMH